MYMRPLFFVAGLVGVLLIAAPLFAISMAVFHFAIPWLLCGLLIWAGFRLLIGPRHPRHGRWHRWDRWDRFAWDDRPWRYDAPRPASPPPPPAPAATPKSAAPAAPDRLPLDVQVKVEQIRRKVEVLLKHAERFPFGSTELHVVRATRDDYLPRTLDAYFALPPNARETARVANGKTALEELRAQLQLLDSKLDEIAEDLERQNLDRLLANRRFLEERFGGQRPPEPPPSGPTVVSF